MSIHIQFMYEIECGTPGCRCAVRYMATGNEIFTPTEFNTKEIAANKAIAYFKEEGWKIGDTYACPICVRREGVSDDTGPLAGVHRLCQSAQVIHNPEVQSAFDRLKRLRQHHSPRIVYSSGDERWLLTYAEINRRVREDERVVLEWYLDNSAGMNILTGTPSDDEPWTREWLLSVGFSDETMNGWVLELPAINENQVPVRLYLDNEYHVDMIQERSLESEVAEDYKDHVAVTSKQYRTKGEVRRLCESLGRKLED